MIGGLGVDIVHIPRIGRAWRRFGERFARKFLSTAETDTLFRLRDTAAQATNGELPQGHQGLSGDQDRRVVEFLASRWAAKEAAYKALGPCTPRIMFTELTVERVPRSAPERDGSTALPLGGGVSSAPRLVLHGSAARSAAEKGFVRSFLSISHDSDYTIAQVIFEIADR